MADLTTSSTCLSITPFETTPFSSHSTSSPSSPPPPTTSMPPLVRTVSSSSNPNNMHMSLENPTSSSTPSSSPRRLNTLQSTLSRSSHHPSPGSPSSTSSPAHTRTRSPPLATTAATAATVTTFSSSSISSFPTASSVTNTFDRTTTSQCKQQERDQECPDNTIALSRLLEHRLSKGSPMLPLLTISTPPQPLPITSLSSNKKDSNNHINSAGTSCSPSTPALVSSSSSPSSADSSNASSPCSLTDPSEVGAPSPATPLNNLPFLLSQPIMPMSVIPAAIMGAKAVSPCVAVGNIFNLKNHPSTPTAAACLLPLVGRDYLSYGNLNALATGKMAAETKPRPLSSMEYAEAWLPPTDASGQPTSTDSPPANTVSVPESIANDMPPFTKEQPKLPDSEEQESPSSLLTPARPLTSITTEVSATFVTATAESQLPPPRLSSSSNDLTPIHPLELAPDTSPLLTASFSQYLAGGDFVVAEEPVGPLSLPPPQKSHSLTPLPVDANRTTTATTFHPLDGQESLSSSVLPPLPSTTATTSSPGIQLTSVPTLLSVPDQSTVGRRHSEPSPTTAKATQEYQQQQQQGVDGQPTRVIRKKTSFASKLRKVFVIKPPQAKESDDGDQKSSANSSGSFSKADSLSVPSSSCSATEGDKQQTQQQQQQHRGSVSSSSSSDTAVGYGKSRGSGTLQVAGANSGGARSREGSASSQPYSPVTSPDLSPTASPKLNHSTLEPPSSSSIESGGSSSSSEMALEPTPTRTIKKRLSFASISSFFQPRNASSASSNTSDDGTGSGASRSEEESKKKLQRSSSVPNTESPLSVVGRQLAGFQRRHSLNDLDGNGKLKDQEEVYKQNLDLQRKGAWDKEGESAQMAQNAVAIATTNDNQDGVTGSDGRSKQDGQLSEPTASATRTGGNHHGTKRTFNVFQAPFSSLSRRHKLQQQQQKQKQARPAPAQPLRSALRRLPPQPVLEVPPNGGANCNGSAAAECAPRRSSSTRSHNSARGEGRRHGPVSYSSTQLAHQHPYHPTHQHRHSEPTVVRQQEQQSNGTATSPTASSRTPNNSSLAVEDLSRPPRPRLSFIQVDDHSDDGYVYCSSPLPIDSENHQQQHMYAFSTTEDVKPHLSLADAAAPHSMSSPSAPHVHSVQTKSSHHHSLQNGAAPSGLSPLPSPSCCSFLSDSSDEGSMHDGGSEGEDDDHEGSISELSHRDNRRGRSTARSGQAKKRRHDARHHHQQQQQQHHSQAITQGSDQYRSVLPTNAARISVDRIVMEHEEDTGRYYQHQDAVMNSPTSHGSNHNNGEYSYDAYSTSYGYDAVQMQLQAQNHVYQLEQQQQQQQQYSPSSSGSSSSSSSMYTPYPAATYINGSTYHHHQGYTAHQQMLPPVSSGSAPGSQVPTRRPIRQIQFSTEEPLIHATWTAEQYDRTSDANITALRLTPAIAQKIKLELNQFKSQEMAVHQDSRIYTHFFV